MVNQLCPVSANVSLGQIKIIPSVEVGLTITEPHTAAAPRLLCSGEDLELNDRALVHLQTSGKLSISFSCPARHHHSCSSAFLERKLTFAKLCELYQIPGVHTAKHAYHTSPAFVLCLLARAMG